MYEQDIHIHHSLLQLCSIKAVCQLRRVSSCSPALESKLSIAKTSDRVPNVALMLLRKRMQSSHRCSVVTASVPLTGAKLRVLQTRQRKAALLNQKQRLCRNWAQQKARAAPMSSASWLSDETRNGQLQHATVTPAPLDRITAARRRYRKQGQKTIGNREEKQIVLAEQAGFLELPHARSCCTTCSG